jgi:ribulose-5-phosphate 4-epimerase/fuculose-1-phosphate aldolase
MTDLNALKKMLVAGNRILGNEGIVDAWGHISVRNPDNPNHYFLSRSRSPELVELDDILEFDLDNKPIKDDGTPIYIERPIHGSIYKARPEVNSVVHNHCMEILPFGVTQTEMRPVVHNARRLGERIGVWDIREKFGDTDLLVTTNAQGDDLAKKLGAAKAVLMRGHGCAVTGLGIPDSVGSSIAMKNNAATIMSSLILGGQITYLSPGEISRGQGGQDSLRGHDRGWEYLLRRSGISL